MRTTHETTPRFAHEMFEDFTAYLESQNYSPATVTAYRSDFRLFHKFLKDQDVLELTEIDSSLMRLYPRWLHRSGLKRTNSARRINSL